MKIRKTSIATSKREKEEVIGNNNYSLIMSHAKLLNNNRNTILSYIPTIQMKGSIIVKVQIKDKRTVCRKQNINTFH